MGVIFSNHLTQVLKKDSEVSSYYSSNKEDYHKMLLELTIAVFEIEATESDRASIEASLKIL